MDVDVAGRRHPARDLVRDVQRAVRLLGGLGAEGDGAQDRPVGRHGLVVAVGAEVDVDGFEEARAGFQVGEGVFEQVGEGGQAAEHHGGVDEVEGGALARPRRLGRVVDLEEEVGRHGGGLDGGEVGPRDVGARVGVGHLDGPDARPRADVEDGWRRDGERGEVQAVAVQALDAVVLAVGAGGLGVVVRVEVGAFAVAVVAPAPFDGVVEDGVGEGFGFVGVVVVGAGLGGGGEGGGGGWGFGGREGVRAVGVVGRHVGMFLGRDELSLGEPEGCFYF